jgi:hypothetical protein
VGTPRPTQGSQPTLSTALDAEDTKDLPTVHLAGRWIGMKRWVFSWPVAMMILVLGASCARHASDRTGAAGSAGAGRSASTSGNTDRSKLIVTPSSGVAGTVTFVNTNARYVVISYPVGVLPEIGRRLSVYRGGLKVGEIRVSGPQRDVNTVADIVAGEAQLGDEVRPE